MTDLPFDPLELMREHPEKMRIPGGLFSKQGPQEYVGGVPAITGTLFFNDVHTPAAREAICACFEDYELLAKQHLTWLWREESADGQDKIAYPKAKSMQTMLKNMDEDDLVSFTYIIGEQPHDAGEWEFAVFGKRAWQAKMIVRGTSVLRFSMPILYVEENPTAFQKMFSDFARRLKTIHGYAGNGLILSAIRDGDNQPFEAFLADKLNGLDAGDPVGAAASAHLGIKTVSWLTAVNNELVDKAGGRTALFSELPMDWFAMYDYGRGIIIQAGPKPEAAPVDVGPKPARLALPNWVFKDIRAPKMRMHNASRNGEPRMIGWAAEQWMKRFDIAEDEVMAFKAKLLREPKLTKETVLPGAINRP